VDARREGSVLILTNALAAFNGRIEFFAGQNTTQPLSGSETKDVLRKHGEQWTLSLPSNAPAGEHVDWALRLAPQSR
jgi:hypothetical protein